MTKRMKLIAAFLVALVFGTISTEADAYKRHRIFDRVDTKATFGPALGCNSISLDLYARDFRRWIDGDPFAVFTAGWLIEGQGCSFVDDGDETGTLVLKDTRDELSVMLTGSHGVYFYNFRRTGRLKVTHVPDDVPGNCKNRTKTVTTMTGVARLSLPASLGGGTIVSTSATNQRKHRNVVRNNAGPGGPC